MSVAAVSLWLGNMGSAQTPAQKAAQTKTEGAAAPQLLGVNVVHVKPEMALEWEEFQKKEVMPTLQKGGIQQRDAWRTAIGEAYEIAFVTPMVNLAARDEPSPIVKALGEEGARAYGAKNRRFIASSRSFVIRTRPDLSYQPTSSEPPKLAVLSSLSIAPGRITDYENHVKTDVLPIQQQAQSLGYLVSQTIFGGDGSEFVTLTLVNTFADLDKGPAAVRVPGRRCSQALGEIGGDHQRHRTGRHSLRPRVELQGRELHVGQVGLPAKEVPPGNLPPCSPPPFDPRRPICIDAKRRPARRLVRQALP